MTRYAAIRAGCIDKLPLKKRSDARVGGPQLAGLLAVPDISSAVTYSFDLGQMDASTGLSQSR